jgi:hypothetical protein
MKINIVMKINLLIIACALPVIIAAQDIQPEMSWKDGTKISWYNDGVGGLGVVSGTYNGTVYIFNFQDGGKGKEFPYVYTFRNDHSTDALASYVMGPSTRSYFLFGYYDETNSSSYYNTTLWEVCTFNFNGRLWYYQQLQQHEDYYGNDYYHFIDCFAQMPEDNTKDPYTYSTSVNDSPLRQRIGAFQVGDSLYFIYNDLDILSSSAYKWVLEEYRFDTVANKFVATGWTKNTGKPAGPYPRSIIKRLDDFGNEYVLVSSVDYSYTDIYRFVPYMNNGRRDFAIEPFADKIFEESVGVGSGIVFEGSIKGQKTSDKHEMAPDRITVIGIENTKNSTDGTYHIDYVEFRDTNSAFIKVNEGRIIIPSTISTPASLTLGLQSCGTFELVPTDWTHAMQGIDGYSKYLWFFYPDGSKYFNGIGFKSDNWMINADSTVKSYDLADTTYSGIKDLWTLIGIVDGAPPVSMNWEKWDEANADWVTPASFLKFSVEGEKKVEISTSTEDQWSIGESVEIERTHKILRTSLSEEFTYSNTYRNTYGDEFDTVIEYDLEFSLRPEPQEYGYYIWKVPKIKRYRYSAYPWWDTVSLQYPIPSSTQYLFRTTGYNILAESIPIEESPFEIESPNASNMADWQYTARNGIYGATLAYDLDPALTIGWNSSSGGSSGTLAQVSDSASSYETTNTYEINGSIGLEYKVPKVFRVKADVNGGWEGTYETENSVETEFSESVEASLAPLLTANSGPNVNSLALDVWLFGPLGKKDRDYWYYDSLDGARPWYLAYTLNSGKEGCINQLSPNDGDEVTPSQLIFSWEAENAPVGNYSLIISTTPGQSAGSYIINEPVGEKTFATIGRDKLETGRTYYWTVKGINRDQNPVRSTWRAFKLAEEDNAVHGNSGLKAIIWPNPADKADFHIIIEPGTTGKISLSIFNAQGAFVAGKEAQGIMGNQQDISFSCPGLPSGVYFAVIRNGEEEAVKKVMIR